MFLRKTFYISNSIFSRNHIYSDNGVDWDSAGYVGTTDHLHSVTYSEYYNKFVAVGSSGTIIESTDGMSWKSIYKNPLLFFNGISSFGNEFIIVTGNGTASISTNLIDWEVLDIENNGYIDKIISANGKLFTLVSFWRKWGLR